MQRKGKVILFGGSFDPIHTGHVRVAQYAIEELNAEKLIFIPARRSPHKSESPTSGHHRLAMIRMAIEGSKGMAASDCELTRREPSYSFDTVQSFREQFGNDVLLYWLIGADQVKDLCRWYRVHELMEICRISVMIRAGYPLPDFDALKEPFSESQIRQLKKDFLMTPRIELSGTDIRRQLTRGSINPDALSPSVLDYIASHQLYGYSQSQAETDKRA